MWAGIQSSGATKAFPVFVKGSKKSNFLVNNVVSKKLLRFLTLLFEEALACSCGELNVVPGACEKGDANTNILEALKRTLLWCSIPLERIWFYLCAPSFYFLCLCGSWSAAKHPPGAPNPMASRAAENRCCLIKVLAFHHTGAHVLPKPQFTLALEASTNPSQKHVLFQCQCWNMC